jgi:hypothetical protein
MTPHDPVQRADLASWPFDGYRLPGFFVPLVIFVESLGQSAKTSAEAFCNE